MISKPDIIETLQNEGVKLKKRSRNYWGLCPLHGEKKPSFTVDEENQSFRCFGCQEHGDVISFIQKFRGLDFKGALQYLGINGSPSHEAIPRKKIDQRRRELIQGFRMWIKFYSCHLCKVYRAVENVVRSIQSEEDLERYGMLYHFRTQIEHRLDILDSEDDERIFHLYTEVNGNGNRV